MTTEKISATASVISAIIALSAVLYGISKDERLMNQSKIKFTIEISSRSAQTIAEKNKSISKMINKTIKDGATYDEFWDFVREVSLLSREFENLNECIKSDICAKKIACSSIFVEWSAQLEDKTINNVKNGITKRDISAFQFIYKQYVESKDEFMSICFPK